MFAAFFRFRLHPQGLRRDYFRAYMTADCLTFLGSLTSLFPFSMTLVTQSRPSPSSIRTSLHRTSSRSHSGGTDPLQSLHFLPVSFFFCHLLTPPVLVARRAPSSLTSFLLFRCDGPPAREIFKVMVRPSDPYNSPQGSLSPSEFEIARQNVSPPIVKLFLLLAGHSRPDRFAKRSFRCFGRTIPVPG